MTKLIYPSNISELGKLGVDLYFNKVQNFSKDEAENAFRQAVIELVGAKPSDSNYFYKWEENKYKVFNLISETVTVILPVTIDEELNGFADVKSAGWGDQLIFEVTDPRLFEVALVSDGNNNTRRQRLDNGKLTLTPQNRTIHIYEEFYRWVAGRIDWAAMVDRVTRSFLNQIKIDIYNKIYSSYASLGANYKGTGTFSVNQFHSVVQHVEAGSGGLTPTVFGTKMALQKVLNQQLVSYNMMDEINRKGFLANFQGVDLVEIKQAHSPNTDNFAIANDFLLFVPAGINKIVKIGFEGIAIVKEVQANENSDQSIEFQFTQKYDVGILSAGKYAMWQSLS